MGKIHFLKTWPEFFKATKFGKKTFELRINDRDYQVDDVLILQEFDPETGYTGVDDICLDATYTLDKQPFVPEGYVCMAVKERKHRLRRLICLDDLVKRCGYSGNTCNGEENTNGYGCTHRGNKDYPGECHGFCCPIATDASYNDLLELDQELAKEYEEETKKYCFDPDAGLDNGWVVVWRPYYHVRRKAPFLRYGDISP